MLAGKLGLTSLEHADDDALVSDLFGILQQVETDMTLFFRCLMEISASMPMSDATGDVTNNADHMEDAALAGLFRRAFYDEQQAFAPAQLGRLAGWLRRYIARVRLDGEPAELVYQRMSRAITRFTRRAVAHRAARQARDPCCARRLSMPACRWQRSRASHPCASSPTSGLLRSR